jgi:Protein of unknown function (DUF2505)
VKFSIGQSVPVAPDAAIAAYANPAFYEGRAPSGDISLVEVVSYDADASHERIEVRYKFTGSVSSAVRAIIDPAKMSWVTRTDIHRDERRTSFTVLPDHYPDRLECQGSFRFEEGAGGAVSASTDPSVITIEVDLKVHVFLVSRRVEQLIVNGLRTYLTAEVLTLPRFTAGG